MNFEKVSILPTTILKVSTKDIFNQQDLDQMAKVIDEDIENRTDKTNNKKPYQTLTDFFNDGKPIFLQKLKKTFIDSCNLYIKEITSYNSYHNHIKINRVRAWGFRTNNSFLKYPQKLLMHSHTPAFLSGIFYVKLSNEHKFITDFSSALSVAMNFDDVEGVENSVAHWSIFPGHLIHAPRIVNSPEYRYVIGADAYAYLED